MTRAVVLSASVRLVLDHQLTTHTDAIRRRGARPPTKHMTNACTPYRTIKAQISEIEPEFGDHYKRAIPSIKATIQVCSSAPPRPETESAAPLPLDG